MLSSAIRITLEAAIRTIVVMTLAASNEAKKDQQVSPRNNASKKSSEISKGGTIKTIEEGLFS